MGQGDEALEALRDYTARNEETHSAFICYRRREFREALQLMERERKTGHPGCDVLRAYILAELPDGPARALREYEELARRYPSGVGRFATQTVLRLLGKKSEAVADCRDFRQRSAEQFFAVREGDRDRRLLDYNCGLLSAAELLQAARASKAEQCAAHYYIGLDKLADGDRPGAREHFGKAVETRYTHWSLAYEFSRMFLARLEQDPAWPPWIPPRKD